MAVELNARRAGADSSTNDVKTEILYREGIRFKGCSPTPSVTPIRDRAAAWLEMKRWERRDLARSLRAVGLLYSEIRDLVPVAKGTLSGWRRDVALQPAALRRLKAQSRSLESREGAGHRRNILYNGTASIRVRRGRDHLHRVMGWIDALGRDLGR